MGSSAGNQQDYAAVALAGVSGVYLTNWALQYLAYTVRVVFKSCKVIPVMIFGTLLQGRTYSREEYTAGQYAHASLYGICFTSSAAEYRGRVVMFMSVFGLVYSGVLLVATGEAWQAIPHSVGHPELGFWQMLHNSRDAIIKAAATTTG
eukprot:scaffold77575_cov34-Prasinocladus_malaysianus.AAC.2